MSCTVVFKQQFNSRNDAGSAGLNVRHLQYIATRPGTVYNPGCGFGLWGRLPGSLRIENVKVLANAKAAVREASQSHTVYRAVLSVGKQTAQEKDLYRRKTWESLVNTRIQAIAKEMDIKPENFCWCASMHYVEDHPHVHLVYWDNGIDPRPEGMPKEQFEQAAERIRAAFAGELYREEIRELQQEQREQAKELRLQLQSVCLEANPQRGINLSRLYGSPLLRELSGELKQLLQDMPQKGSLRYGYLPKAYKTQVDIFIRHCLELSELGKEFDRYEAYTRQISRLYANSEATLDANLEKARVRLYREMGNQVMDVLKNMQSELMMDPPESYSEAKAFLSVAVAEILPTLDSYAYLQQLLPAERIPISRMEQIPGYHEAMNRVIRELQQDARIRIPLQSYAKQAAMRLPHSEADSPEGEKLQQDILSKEEYADYRKFLEDVQKDLRRQITQHLREDAGWEAEAAQTQTALLLCGMLRLASQLASQKSADLALQKMSARFRSKDQTKEAMRDRQEKQKQAGHWSQDIW